ncbi:MAG TPA: phenazine biosynthesis protein [Cyanobacteria bacterium UBA12227]|nr:phenazine biosynthesis protein [Cyanobacteria bacterium UBA12227]HAX89261.1 phenazine biosynthesis protein [Cyanobacteria bacterium UBA11370]HBY79251.1 phenazine biosynthesis protein [Cyanobacteria bacterium UBA11148]
MKGLNFYIVDVFAVDKYTGNQLAVFTNASGISAAQMQLIAKEINYSETTFITSAELKNGGYDVRTFTPKKELPFAGHPTLGTAYIIQQALINHPVETVNLNLKVGQIPVTWHYGEDGSEVLWMRQNPPTFHQILNADDLAPVLGLDRDEIDDRYPIQEVSTGVPFIIIPLKTHKSLQQIRVNKERYFEFVKNTQAKEILVFCPETYAPENDLSVRVFAESLGIPEDPATGSANGCLAGYLVKYSYFGNQPVDVRVEQGYEIGRPSLLLLKASQNQDTIDVSVGGKVVMIASGEFF